jgi:hypothetical protein
MVAYNLTLTRRQTIIHRAKRFVLIPLVFLGTVSFWTTSQSNLSSSSRILKAIDPKTVETKQTAQNYASRTLVRDFERQDGVVITTMIHGDDSSVQLLKQGLCLFQAAYNARMQYDHVVFTTNPLNSTQIQELQNVVSPGSGFELTSSSRGDCSIAKTCS